MNLADELDASRSIDRDLDARIAVALYKDAENSDSMDNTYARLPSKHDGCTPGTYWISAFSGLSLRTAPGFTGDRLLKQIAIGALRHFHPHNEALHATEPAQDCEAAWKKLREYCTNGLPFYDNEDGWRAIANAVLRAAEPAQVEPVEWEGALTAEEQSMIDRAWETHKAAEPAQVSYADRVFELWFFRDIVDDQRSKLIALMLGGAVAKEATNHGTQPLCLKHILKALRAQGRAEAEREIVALRETVLDEDWLEEAISDSLDLDWQPRIAARLILSRLKESAIDAQG